LENVLDFYQAQHKYRQKQLKFVFSSILKLIFVLFIFLTGWWFGNNDNLILIHENERILNEFNQTKNNLERKLTDIRLKLKEANLALSTQTIKDKKGKYGRYLGILHLEEDGKYININDWLLENDYAVKYE
jgi:hypothetical protein